jgi:hypothetical protein
VDDLVPALIRGEQPLPLHVVAEELVGGEAHLEAPLDHGEPEHQARAERSVRLVVSGLQQQVVPS